jgi:hypothetical protein
MEYRGIEYTRRGSDGLPRHRSVDDGFEVCTLDLGLAVHDFMTGQFNDPVRVVAFNTLEHWADDVSKDVKALRVGEALPM